MIILIHTSKTMRPNPDSPLQASTTPRFISEARELADYAKTLDVSQIKKMMALSDTLANKTEALLGDWSDKASLQRPAIDSFLGDIYSGLQVQNWSEADRLYANQSLRILSGLYGVLRPFDGIFPYRFEMGYKLPAFKYKNLYEFWGTKIADSIPADTVIIDLSAVEYGKTVTQHIDSTRIITPRFLTISPKTGEPTFVVVHAKIARGAFASWMIRNRIEKAEQLERFKEIGYEFSEALSTPSMPVFVCREFGGLGLSVRLT